MGRGGWKTFNASGARGKIAGGTTVYWTRSPNRARHEREITHDDDSEPEKRDKTEDVEADFEGHRIADAQAGPMTVRTSRATDAPRAAEGSREAPDG